MLGLVIGTKAEVLGMFLSEDGQKLQVVIQAPKLT